MELARHPSRSGMTSRTGARLRRIDTGTTHPGPPDGTTLRMNTPGRLPYERRLARKINT
ncbi:protein of unknown function [Streptomyces sp. KY75]|nr:protein of unknown function [Streptomyces sp. KY75]